MNAVRLLERVLYAIPPAIGLLLFVAASWVLAAGVIAGAFAVWGLL